jgi:glutaredoxin
MRTSICLAILISLFFVVTSSEAEIYRRVSQDGTVTFRDTPPPNGQEGALYQPKTSTTIGYEVDINNQQGEQQVSRDETSASSDFTQYFKEQVEARRNRSLPDVELYVTSWCGYCRQAKEFLVSNDVPFEVFDIESDSRAAKRHREFSPSGSVPVAVIGGRTVQGFSPDVYKQALGLQP